MAKKKKKKKKVAPIAKPKLRTLGDLVREYKSPSAKTPEEENTEAERQFLAFFERAPLDFLLDALSAYDMAAFAPVEVGASTVEAKAVRDVLAALFHTIENNKVGLLENKHGPLRWARAYLRKHAKNPIDRVGAVRKVLAFAEQENGNPTREVAARAILLLGSLEGLLGVSRTAEMFATRGPGMDALARAEREWHTKIAGEIERRLNNRRSAGKDRDAELVAKSILEVWGMSEREARNAVQTAAMRPVSPSKSRVH